MSLEGEDGVACGDVEMAVDGQPGVTLRVELALQDADRLAGAPRR